MIEIEQTTEETGMTHGEERPTVVLGAGPAGLTAGYLLAKQGPALAMKGR